MNSYLRVTRIWSDDDLLELRIVACDGQSSFTTDAYVSVSWPSETTESLLVFGKQIHGGIYDLEAGEFGPEYANGAVHARFHFETTGRLFVSVSLQGEYRKYKNTDVASEAKLFMRSEPALLDRFAAELLALNVEKGAVAELECV